MTEPTTAIEPRVSLDDIRHRADAVKSRALTEARSAVDEAVGQENLRTLLIVGGLVVVAASFAFFLGSRSGKASMAEQIFGE
jgi:CDP-diglyceride synthetase